MLSMFIMFEQALNLFFPIFSYPVYLNMLKPYMGRIFVSWLRLLFASSISH